MSALTGFHLSGGLHFQRQPDGGVRIFMQRNTADDPQEITATTAEGWASVVASMSAEGETAETWRAALEAQRPTDGAP